MTSAQTELTKQVSLFVAHGAPDLILSDIPAHKFLQETGLRLPRPRGIVVISAHWSTSDLQMTGPSALETIHDYSGWPAKLYDIEYRASGAGWLNDRLASALDKAGHSIRMGSRMGLDHGAWVPLSLMYPKADIPIVQLSLLDFSSPEQHFIIGQALDGLRHDGVLILGSGGLVHNLDSLLPEGSPPANWAQSFDEWLFDRLESRSLQKLFNFTSESELAHLAHPTNEHLMPLFVSMGAGWSDGFSRRVHQSFSYGNLSMTSYAFGHSNTTKDLVGN